jgi:argininosuccinate lyase
VAATELANMLVQKYNIPFRTAHKIIGALVKSLIESKLTFADATPKLLQKIALEATGIKLTVKAEDITETANPLKLVEKHKVKGGPAPTEVKRAINVRKKQIGLTKLNIAKMSQKLDDAENKLESTVESYSLPSTPENNTRFKNSNL